MPPIQVSPHYRPDIDGLRAIAILAVLSFHLNFSATGYLGVDIFFVISGFLITSLILNEVAEERFSFKAFYIRRIRRLFPAIVFLICIITPLMFFLLPPQKLIAFSNSLTFFTLYASNWYFLHNAGYFDTISASKPLLHTWSLSIEEQFYLVFPVVLIITQAYLDRWKKYVFWGGLFTASIAFQLHLRHGGYDNAAYFNSAARFWELLAGVLCAFVSRDKRPDPRLAWPLGLIGFGLIVEPIIGFKQQGNYSMSTMVLPVIGSVCVILAGCTQQTGINRLLAHKSFVFIGKISYPLYLWHWPLLILAPLLVPLPGLATKFVAITATFVFATISYFVVEMPVRTRSALPTTRALLTLFVIFNGGLLLIAASGSYGGRWVEHIVVGIIAGEANTSTPATYLLGKSEAPKAEALNMQHLLERINTDTFEDQKVGFKCLNSEDNDILADLDKKNLCEIGTHTTGPIDLLVIGDSHMAASYFLYEAIAKKYDLRAQVAGCAANPPLSGVIPKDGRGSFCGKYYDHLYDYIRTVRPKHLIMVARWNGYLHGESDLKTLDMAVTDKEGHAPPAALSEGFKRSLESLPPETDVTVMTQPPEYALAGVPEKMKDDAHSAKTPEEAIAKIENDDKLRITAADQQKHVDELRSALAQTPSIRLLDISPAFCNSGLCAFHTNYVPLYHDGNHLSVEGNRHIFDASGEMFLFLEE